MKTYKVWIRACIEEMCVLRTDDIQEAQEFVDAFEGRL